MPKPGIAKRFEFGWIFMAQNQFCGAAAVRDCIFAGTRFSVGSGWTGAAMARRFRRRLRGTRQKVGGITHVAGAIRVWRTGERPERSQKGQAVDLKRDRLFCDLVNRSWQGPQQGMKTAPNGSIVLVSRERDKRSVSVWRLEARL
jgi:hypothetical protein